MTDAVWRVIDNPLVPQDTLAPLRVALASRYAIEREIGQGAFATVYLPMIPGTTGGLRSSTERGPESQPVSFASSGRSALARLQHPNILPPP